MSTEGETRVTLIRPAPSAKVGDVSFLVHIYPPGPDMGRKFELKDKVVTIGRGATNTIVVDVDSVSRKHAEIESQEDKKIVRDMGSTNGTYVNDRIIEGPCALSNGDLIKVGSTIFKFLAGQNVEAEYHEEIYRMTIVDGLTEIHNKRFLLEFMDREISRCRRYNRPLAVVMFDLDHFKRINDTHGHLTGDYVLREVARLIKGRIRREELFARYGGEEFVIVLPESDREGSLEFAEQLRRMVEQHPFEFEGHRLKVTVSLGVGMLDEGNSNVSKVLRAADEKMYEAKKGGRNRVVG